MNRYLVAAVVTLAVIVFKTNRGMIIDLRFLGAGLLSTPATAIANTLLLLDLRILSKKMRDILIFATITSHYVTLAIFFEPMWYGNGFLFAAIPYFIMMLFLWLFSLFRKEKKTSSD